MLILDCICVLVMYSVIIFICDILSGDVLHKLCNHSAAINSMALRYQVGSPLHKDGPVLEFVVRYDVATTCIQLKMYKFGIFLFSAAHPATAHYCSGMCSRRNSKQN